MESQVVRSGSRIAMVVFISVVGVATAARAHGPSADGGTAGGGTFVVESALLNGLGAGALYPFVDTTPRLIRKAHVAITDSAAECAAGASAPDNIVILVGEAGVELVSVMTADTNTGIGSPAQCVFHVTVQAGKNGVPQRITDIVVVNGGASALTGHNTVTVSARVR